MMREIQNILKVSVLLGLLLSGNAARGQCVNGRAKEHFESARSYDAVGDARAEQEYRRAIELANGRCADAWQWLSNYLAKRLQFRESTDAWRAYLKHRPSKARPNDLLKLRLLKRAAELHSRSVSAQPLSTDEMVELVGLVGRFATQTDAITVAENAVKLHPESAKALVALADLIKFQQKERALELLNRAAIFANEEVFVFIARGWYYFWSQGKPVEAEMDFRRALELSNGLSASAWQGLGDALSRQGRRNEAVEAYRKYLKVRPQSASHYDEVIKRSIENLRSLP
jgi:superkiller protein 3